MNCPNAECLSTDLKTRYMKPNYIRGRVCLKCGQRFTTREILMSVIDPEKRATRNEEIVARVNSGETFTAIGKSYNICRQRVVKIYKTLTRHGASAAPLPHTPTPGAGT